MPIAQEKKLIIEEMEIDWKNHSHEYVAYDKPLSYP